MPGSTILVVDDHPHNLVVLEAVLAPLGEPFQKATSGPEALRLLEQGDYAVALLDVRMPEISGLEVAAQLRQRANHTPIIFLTAAEDTTDLRHQGYALVETFETLLRPWNIDGTSVRPCHRMVAHTGFLTVARRVVPEEGATLPKVADPEND